MVALSLELSEKEIIKAILEFLDVRGLHIAQISLERETGVINGGWSDDVIFLRQLIIDGQWDTVLEFIEPLTEIADFNAHQFRYLIAKYKYFELLCLQQDPGPLQDNEFTVEEVVETLKLLETLCPTQEDYRNLCLLLTLPKLSEHVQFKHWNPSSARMECFYAVYPLVKKFLTTDAKATFSESQNDRLIQLLVKGIFYESCVEYCQAKAVASPMPNDSITFGRLFPVTPSKLVDADVSLVSWLQSVPNDVFTRPFEQKTFSLKLDELRKPTLDAVWTEQILVTPIKPQQFPHALVPTSKLRAAEKMSQSMIPAYETGNANLNSLMTQSVLLSVKQGPMSRSTLPESTSFQITNRRDAQNSIMDKSIDQLLETSDARFSGGVAKPMLQGVLSDPVAPSGHNQFSTLPNVPEESELASLASPHQSHLSLVIPPGEAGPIYASDMVPHQQQQPQQYPSQFGGYGSLPLHASTAGMMSNSVYGGTPAHAQLDEIKRLSLQASPQRPPGMRQSQQLTMEQNPAMIESTGKLFQEFRGKRKPVVSASQQQQQHGFRRQLGSGGVNNNTKHSNGELPRSSIQFAPVHCLEDAQAIRATAFHPSGKYYAVGTNSKQLHICKYPDMQRHFSTKHNMTAKKSEILLTRAKQHRGSVYCVAFNPTGNIMATGSNDKTVKLMQFHTESCKIGSEYELNIHDGTVRDLVFIEDQSSSQGSSLLVSGGAGNCRINVTDCVAGQTIRQYPGHTGPILGLYASGGSCMFVSCSQDHTIRFWDLRSAQAVNVIAPDGKIPGAPVTSVCVDPTGRLLVSGHEDSTIMLYDVPGSRVVQIYKPHQDAVRTVRFSPGNYYLLSGSYDKRIVVTDIRGDLVGPLTYIPVAEHQDKIIQCRWHPKDFTFLSTSADKTSMLWALPPQ